MSKELKKNIELINKNLGMLRSEYYVKNVGIFGSFAKGKHTKKSDLDILVDFSKPIGFFKFVRLERELSKILKKNVDLVSKGALKPMIKNAILKEVVYA